METAKILRKSVLNPGNNWITLLNSANLIKKNAVTPVNFHLYHYAGNNPVRYTDPDGRDTNLPFAIDNSYMLDNIPSECVKAIYDEEYKDFSAKWSRYPLRTFAVSFEGNLSKRDYGSWCWDQVAVVRRDMEKNSDKYRIKHNKVYNFINETSGGANVIADCLPENISKLVGEVSWFFVTGETLVNILSSSVHDLKKYQEVENFLCDFDLKIKNICKKTNYKPIGIYCAVNVDNLGNLQSVTVYAVLQDKDKFIMINDTGCSGD